MIVREPNGEPRLMVILHGQAIRSLAQHRDATSVRELIPGGRAWQRMSAFVESSRPGHPGSL